MSLSLVHSRALLGLEARPVCVEVHLANGLPSFTLVGLADTGVKEARERVRSAIANAGLEFPSNKRITVNLAPADLPKDSARYKMRSTCLMSKIPGLQRMWARRVLEHLLEFHREICGENSVAPAVRPGHENYHLRDDETSHFVQNARASDSRMRKPNGKRSRCV